MGKEFATHPASLPELRAFAQALRLIFSAAARPARDSSRLQMEGLVVTCPLAPDALYAMNSVVLIEGASCFRQMKTARLTGMIDP